MIRFDSLNWNCCWYVTGRAWYWWARSAVWWIAVMWSKASAACCEETWTIAAGSTTELPSSIAICRSAQQRWAYCRNNQRFNCKWVDHCNKIVHYLTLITVSGRFWRGTRRPMHLSSTETGSMPAIAIRNYVHFRGHPLHLNNHSWLNRWSSLSGNIGNLATLSSWNISFHFLINKWCCNT